MNKQEIKLDKSNIRKIMRKFKKDIERIKPVNYIYIEEKLRNKYLKYKKQHAR